jgi:DNA polymerase-3 subunit beta
MLPGAGRDEHPGPIYLTISADSQVGRTRARPAKCAGGPPQNPGKRRPTGRCGLAESAPARHFQGPWAGRDALFSSVRFMLPLPPGGAGLDMKVTVERATLLKSLGHVHRVVERRNTIPILANVLIRADKSTLTLKATDLDLEVTEGLAAEVATGGSTTVPAHMIYDIVRKLPEGAQIVLETLGDRASLAIRAGRSRFTLQTLPESDFPDLAAGEMTHKFTLPAADLKRLIDKTQFAISTEETRYYLNGIYLHTAGNAKTATLRAVATDGHRLAQVEMAAPKGAAGMPGIIVPRKAVGEVQRLIEDTDAEVEIELSQTKIRFTIGSVVLTSKLIDGTFPDYARVIPLGNDKELVVDNADFEAAVDRVSTVSSERGRAVKLSLTGGKLNLSVINPDSGSATEEIEVEYNADPLDIGFNSRYLLDIAAQIEGEVAVLKLADPGSPTLIQDREAAGALYVLMPMRV